MTQFNPNHPLVLATRGWDKISTGLAPGDGQTECGFCERDGLLCVPIRDGYDLFLWTGVAT